MKVSDLTPGDLVTGPSATPATFVIAAAHPLFPGLQLVVWRMEGGRTSLDALSAAQEIGEIYPSPPAERLERLRAALLGA